MDFDNIIGVRDNSNLDGMSWKCYGAYKFYRICRRFFFGDRPKKRRENPYADIVETTISTLSYNQDPQLLKASKEILEQQRMLDDTLARRRLERWTKRVISWYLIAVFFLICADSAFYTFKVKHFLTEAIFIAILTTTTVNILGLGFIVLKGHFPNKEEK